MDNAHFKDKISHILIIYLSLYCDINKVLNMKNISFFSNTTSLDSILKSIPNDSLLVLDLDETVAVGSIALGLSAWFYSTLKKISQHSILGAEALFHTKKLYNRIQNHPDFKMMPVEDANTLSAHLPALRARGVKIIGLTARNEDVRDATLTKLKEMGVEFDSDAVPEDQTFSIQENRMVTIKGGIIFCDGSNKGGVITHMQKNNLFDLKHYTKVTFVDDGHGNCQAVLGALKDLKLPYRVWHYTHAEDNHPFDSNTAWVQLLHLQLTNKLLTNSEAKEFADAEAYLPFDGDHDWADESDNNTTLTITST